ncbi:MAG: zinc ABC transporter ATP-binding protein ZnuC [Rhodospirillales bacterium CG15_BIG_FIL_POST_REV_8_21_14_020_66_15]|nr:MAG: zinc ABC transporter ATP-binding protein ZnuC [Rhodospirillales bacterium CG15_BIG_FIL_POST_REV_8_21_14_020_66_15]
MTQPTRAIDHGAAPGQADGALFRATGVGVRRSGDWLVRGVDLTIHPGKIVTLIGPNGSGKTTTAKVVLGLIRPDAGRIERAAGLRIGYVPQRLTIDDTLPFTVKRLMTMTGPADDADIARALERAGVGHLGDAAVQRLSGGEFQRTLMARAILRRPDLLILDEPVQGVDFAGEVTLYELIRDIRDELRCGILLISHDLHFVMADTDRVLCLNRHVCCAGTPQSVAADPEYRRLFGPRAVEALAVYQHHHNHTHGPDGTVIPLESRNPAAHTHGDGAICRLDHEHGHGLGPDLPNDPAGAADGQ